MVNAQYNEGQCTCHILSQEPGLCIILANDDATIITYLLLADSLFKEMLTHDPSQLTMK